MREFIKNHLLSFCPILILQTRLFRPMLCQRAYWMDKRSKGATHNSSGITNGSLLL